MFDIAQNPAQFQWLAAALANRSQQNPVMLAGTTTGEPDEQTREIARIMMERHTAPNPRISELQQQIAYRPMDASYTKAGGIGHVLASALSAYMGARGEKKAQEAYLSREQEQSEAERARQMQLVQGVSDMLGIPPDQAAVLVQSGALSGVLSNQFKDEEPFRGDYKSKTEYHEQGPQGPGNYLIEGATSPEGGVTWEPQDQWSLARQSGPATEVNMNMPEGPYEVPDKVVEKADSANETIGILNQMEFALDQGADPGILPEQRLALAKGLQYAGVPSNVAGNLAASESFFALGGALTMETLGKFKGAISDSERQFAASINPNLGMSLQGNRMLIPMMRATAFKDVLREEFHALYEKDAGKKWTRARRGLNVMGVNESGNLVFLDEFVNKYAQDNPDAELMDIINDWKKLYKLDASRLTNG